MYYLAKCCATTCAYRKFLVTTRHTASSAGLHQMLADRIDQIHVLNQRAGAIAGFR